MSYTASALKILSRRYRLVLLKCALLNAGLLLTTSSATAGTFDGLKEAIAFPTEVPYVVGYIAATGTLGTLGSNGGGPMLTLRDGTITAIGGSFGGVDIPIGNRRLELINVTFNGFTSYDVSNNASDLLLVRSTLNTGITGTGRMTVTGGEASTVVSITQDSVYISKYTTLNVNNMPVNYVNNNYGTLNVVGNLTANERVINEGTLNITDGTLAAEVVGDSGRTLITGNVTATNYLRQTVNISSTGHLTVNANRLSKDPANHNIIMTNEGALTLTGSDNAAAPSVAYADISNGAAVTTSGHINLAGKLDGEGGTLTIDATAADASLTLAGQLNTNTIQATGGNTASLIIANTSVLNNGGALNVATTINAGAKMNSNAGLIGAALTNNGTLELMGGTTTQEITNNSLITVTNNTSLGNLSGTGTVANNATLTLTGTTNTNTINGSGRIIIDNAGFETTGALNQAVTINAGKQLTAAANLIGGTVTNNGTIVLNSGTSSSSIIGGTTQIAASQTVTANASLATTAIVNYGILNISFANLFGDVLSDDGIENNGAASELHVNGDGALTRTINGDGKTYLNGNIIWDDGSVSLGDTILQSGSMTVEAIADVHGELRMNGKLTMELYEVSANFSGYAGGKLIVHETFTVSPNTTLELVVDSDSLNLGESTGDLVLIDAAGYAGDFAELAQNNRYGVIKTGNGTYRLTYVDSAENIAKEVGANPGAAEAWDKVDPRRASTPAGRAIAEKLNYLSQYDKVAYGQTLDSLTPTTSGTVTALSSGVTSMIGLAVSSRVNTISEMPQATSPASGRSGGDSFSDQGAWGQMLFNYSKQNKSSKTVGFEGGTAGAAFGFDGQINDDVTLGFGYAYSRTDVDSAERSIDVEGHTLFGYAQYLLDEWFFRSSLSYGMAKYDEKTAVAGIGLKADYNVYTAALSTTTGYDFGNGIIPEGGLRASRISRHSYNDTAGQHISKDNMNSLTLVAGSRFVKTSDDDSFKWSVSAKTALTYDLLSENASSVVTVGDSAYFVKGRRLNRLGAEAGIGAQTSYNNWDFSLDYDVDFKYDFQSHTLSLKAEYNF